MATNTQTAPARKTSRGTKIKHKYTSKSFWVKFLGNTFKTVLLIGISFIILFPFFVKISSSLMSMADLSDKTVKYIPRDPTLANFTTVLTLTNYFDCLKNTLILSVICGVLQMLVSACVGYGLAKFKFRGRNFVFIMVVLTLLIPPQTTMVTMYSQFRYFDPLYILRLIGVKPPSLIGSPMTVYILSLFGIGLKNGLFIFMMRQFYKGLPNELAEAAYVDGYGVYKTFVRIILPLSRPMLITIFLLVFSWQWTDTYYSSLLFKSYNVLPNILSAVTNMPGLLVQPGSPISAVYSNVAALLIVAPITLIYLFTQKFLVAGIERTGLVG